MISKTLKATIKNTIKELKLERDRIIRFIDSMQELLEPSADIPEPKTKRAGKVIKRVLKAKVAESKFDRVALPNSEFKGVRGHTPQRSTAVRRYECMDCPPSTRLYSRGELEQHQLIRHNTPLPARNSRIGRPRKVESNPNPDLNVNSNVNSNDTPKEPADVGLS